MQPVQQETVVGPRRRPRPRSVVIALGWFVGSFLVVAILTWAGIAKYFALTQPQSTTTRQQRLAFLTIVEQTLDEMIRTNASPTIRPEDINDETRQHVILQCHHDRVRYYLYLQNVSVFKSYDPREVWEAQQELWNDRRQMREELWHHMRGTLEMAVLTYKTKGELGPVLDESDDRPYKPLGDD